MAIIPTTPASPSVYFKITPLPNKGLSAIATTRIPAHTLLFTESPLLTIPYSHTAPPSALLKPAFLSLPPSSQSALLSLAGSESGIEGAWKCNNFMLDHQGLLNGVFLGASRINHACVGGENAFWRWDGVTGVIGFWTGKEVLEGEEITHCYRTDWRMGTKLRREALFGEYGFWCVCVVCEGVDD